MVHLSEVHLDGARFTLAVRSDSVPSNLDRLVFRHPRTGQECVESFEVAWQGIDEEQMQIPEGAVMAKLVKP